MSAGTGLLWKAMLWYYAKDGRRFGPVEEIELQELASRGGLLPDDLIWNPGLKDRWIPAHSLMGLFPDPSPTDPMELALRGESGSRRGNRGTQTPSPQPADQSSSIASTATKLAAPVGGAALLGLKYLAGLKFLLPMLQTGATMILSIWAYAMLWGWRFAAGFVVLILVHECGHLVAARWCGLKVGAPVFIPFMGALIALKEAPGNAWIEAVVGIGGPILGSLGALACEGLFLMTGNPLYRALAYTGFFLNLFNLTPVGFLDGGRIVAALSPWIWLLGFVILAVLTWLHFNLLLLLIMILCLPRVLSLFRPQTVEEHRYFEVPPARRLIMATLYFGLIVLLVLGMQATHANLPSH